MPSSGMAKSLGETKTTMSNCANAVIVPTLWQPTNERNAAQTKIITTSTPYNRLRHVSYSRDFLHTHDRR